MDAFLAEIRIFPFNFAPRGWAQCAGQLMPISQNTALFSLLGTYYGGDGKTSFALPNLQGAVPVSTGQSAGGSQWYLGESTGVASYTLLQTEMAAHNHGLVATSTVGTQTSSVNAQLAQGYVGSLQSSTSVLVYSTGAPGVTLAPQSISVVGGSQPHNNMMPYLAMNFCIALQGQYPTRN